MFGLKEDRHGEKVVSGERRPGRKTKPAAECPGPNPEEARRSTKGTRIKAGDVQRRAARLGLAHRRRRARPSRERLGAIVVRAKRGEFRESDLFLRIFNEISVIGVIAILWVVVAKPF